MLCHRIKDWWPMDGCVCKMAAEGLVTSPSLFVNMFLSLQNVIFEANVCLWRFVLAVMDSFSTFCDMIFTVVCKLREF